MDITWFGRNCFRISERGHTSVVTDPHKPATGAPGLKLRADLVTVSHEISQHNVDQVKNHDYVISGAGEYEVGDLFVTGIPLHIHDPEKDRVLDNIAYLFEFANNLSVLHLGNLRQVPDQSMIEQLDEVNVLMMPVNGGAGLPNEQLAELISLIEPNLVVPMYRAKNGNAGEETIVEGFLKAMGVGQTEPVDNLRVTTSALPEQTQVALLRASSVLI